MYLYRFLNEKKNVIYVGKTQNLKSRISNHISGGHLPRQCYKEVFKIEYIEFENDADCSVYEPYFINIFRPIYNTEFKSKNRTTFELPEVKWVNYEDFKTEELKRVKTFSEEEVKNKTIKFKDKILRSISKKYGYKFIENVILEEVEFFEHSEGMYFKVMKREGDRIVSSHFQEWYDEQEYSENIYEEMKEALKEKYLEIKIIKAIFEEVKSIEI